MQNLTFTMWLQKVEHSAKKGFFNLVVMENFSVNIRSMRLQYSKIRKYMYDIMLKSLGSGVLSF